MEIRIRSTGESLLANEWCKWVAKTYGKSVGPITPEAIRMFDSDPIFEGPQPTTSGPYEYVIRQGIEQQSDGNWYTKYVVQTLNDEGKAAKDIEVARSVRSTRDQFLSETDWVVIKALENKIEVPDAYKAYRQALRDVPTQSGFPHNVTWPTKPE